MKHWLLKSEPGAFSYQDLERVKREPWNGVRNYQARNFLRQMEVNDLCLFYHSNVQPPGIVGLARVARAAYPDDLQFDLRSRSYDPRSSQQQPRWSMVDVVPVRAFVQLLPLSELRALESWQASPLLQKRQRLSVMPVTPAQFASALRAARLDPADYLTTSPAERLTAALNT